MSITLEEKKPKLGTGLISGTPCILPAYSVSYFEPPKNGTVACLYLDKTTDTVRAYNPGLSIWQTIVTVTEH